MPDQPIIDFTPERRAALLRLIYDAYCILTHPERRKVFDQPGSTSEEAAFRMVRIGLRTGLVSLSDLEDAADTLAQRLTVARRSDGLWGFATPEEAAAEPWRATSVPTVRSRAAAYRRLFAAADSIERITAANAHHVPHLWHRADLSALDRAKADLRAAAAELGLSPRAVLAAWRGQKEKAPPLAGDGA